VKLAFPNFPERGAGEQRLVRKMIINFHGDFMENIYWNFLGFLMSVLAAEINPQRK